MSYYRISLLPFVLLELVASVLFVLGFGFGNFLIFLLVSVLIGVVLLGVFWKNMLEFQILAPKEMFAQFAYVIAAFLFIIPGILSSSFALFILVFALVFQGRKKPKSEEAEFEVNEGNFKQKDYEEIIDVEIIEDKR